MYRSFTHFSYIYLPLIPMCFLFTTHLYLIRPGTRRISKNHILHDRSILLFLLYIHINLTPVLRIPLCSGRRIYYRGFIVYLHSEIQNVLQPIVSDSEKSLKVLRIPGSDAKLRKHNRIPSHIRWPVGQIAVDSDSLHRHSNRHCSIVGIGGVRMKCSACEQEKAEH